LLEGFPALKVRLDNVTLKVALEACDLLVNIFDLYLDFRGTVYAVLCRLFLKYVQTFLMYFKKLMKMFDFVRVHMPS
jgi:hypothetical protein